MVRHSSDVYSLGGYTGTSQTNKVYRLRDGVWTALPGMSVVKYFFAAVLYDSTIFTFGGPGSLDKVEAFNIATQTWTNKAQPPLEAQRYSQAAAVYRHLIWHCGGFRNGASSTNACFTYDPQTNTWAPAANMTMARYSFGLVVRGEVIYAIGGQSGPGKRTAERYKTSTNAWELLPGNLTNDAFKAVILPVE